MGLVEAVVAWVPVLVDSVLVSMFLFSSVIINSPLKVLVVDHLLRLL